MKYINTFYHLLSDVGLPVPKRAITAPLKERYIRPGKMLSGRQKSAEQVPTGGISPSIWNTIKKN